MAIFVDQFAHYCLFRSRSQAKENQKQQQQKLSKIHENRHFAVQV